MWLFIVALLLIVVEVLTVSTFFIWVSLGVFASALTSLVTDNVVIITLVGIVITILSLVMLRTKYFNYARPKKIEATAYEKLIGKKATMLEDYLTNGANTSSAKVDGVIWTVICETSATKFNKNEIVLIEDVVGSKLVIRKED